VPEVTRVSEEFEATGGAYRAPRLDRGEGVERDGRLFTLVAGGRLPACCVWCGEPAMTWPTRKFTWHPPWMYLLIPLGLLVYAIAALSAQKTWELDIPLCEADRRARGNRIAIGWLLAVGAFPLGYVVAILPGDTIWAAFSTVLVLVVAGVVIANRATHVLSPKFIDAGRATFGGACEAFLARLEPRP
jgi:hypothetical protein